MCFLFCLTHIFLLPTAAKPSCAQTRNLLSENMRYSCSLCLLESLNLASQKNLQPYTEKLNLPSIRTTWLSIVKPSENSFFSPEQPIFFFASKIPHLIKIALIPCKNFTTKFFIATTGINSFNC